MDDTAHKRPRKASSYNAKTYQNENRKPTCPNKSNKLYYKFWQRVLDDLWNRENFKKSHMSQIERLVEVQTAIAETKLFLDKNGFWIDDPKLGRRERPELNTYLKLLQQVRSLEIHMGITPYQDRRLKKNMPKEKNPWDK